VSIDEIATLWVQDKPLSAIGAALGVSRSVVAGLIGRARKNGDARFAPRPPAPKPPKPAAVSKPAPNPPVRQPLPLFELKPGMCRYPTNDPPPHGQFLFCREPASKHGYCEHHAKITRTSGR
jgi:hypothetical protein